MSFKETENKVARAVEGGLKGESTVTAGISRGEQAISLTCSEEGTGRQLLRLVLGRPLAA